MNTETESSLAQRCTTLRSTRLTATLTNVVLGQARVLLRDQKENICIVFWRRPHHGMRYEAMLIGNPIADAFQRLEQKLHAFEIKGVVSKQNSAYRIHDGERTYYQIYRSRHVLTTLMNNTNLFVYRATFRTRSSATQDGQDEFVQVDFDKLCFGSSGDNATV